MVLVVAPAAADWHFTEISELSGLDYEHGFDPSQATEPHLVSGGVAAGDFDGDGWLDLYVVRGSMGPNLLFRNLGDVAGGMVSFEEVGESAGVAISGALVGPAFADLDGDGWLDLVVGGIAGDRPRLLRNRGDLSFEEVTADSGIFATRDTFSTALGDYDRDGDLDLFFSHWSPAGPDPIGAPHLWRNDSSDGGGIAFSPVDFAAGIAPAYEQTDFSFTPTFTDFDADGWPDLLVAGDFGTSQVFHNLGAGAGGTVTFEIVTGPVISDQNGMGSAVGDYDNDGDLDWFVSSIWDPDGIPNGNWGVTGNRLYRNTGGAPEARKRNSGAPEARHQLAFEDATDEAGVRQGYWGWGSCFADFNNDGYLDLFHTNGFQVPAATEFHHDPARMFVSDGVVSGAVRFTERAVELGVADQGQGRGVVCFDVDRDGDVDLFVANHTGPPLLYRNDGGNQLHYLQLRLHGKGGNSEAIGAWVTATTAGTRQLREIRAGSNYVSQNPAEAHFGLGTAEQVDELHIRWPDGEIQVIHGVAADRLLEIEQGFVPPVVDVPALSFVGGGLLALMILAIGIAILRRIHRP